MPRGGRRSGRPGKGYPQRSDLMTQPRRAATGQQYGQAGAQLQAQSAMPLPQQAPPAVVPLDAPTARPDEPVTAGLSQGPGPGPEVLSTGGGTSDTLTRLKMLWNTQPNDDLGRLIADMESDAGA